MITEHGQNVQLNVEEEHKPEPGHALTQVYHVSYVCASVGDNSFYIHASQRVKKFQIFSRPMPFYAECAKRHY